MGIKVPEMGIKKVKDTGIKVLPETGKILVTKPGKIFAIGTMTITCIEKLPVPHYGHASPGGPGPSQPSART